MPASRDPRAAQTGKGSGFKLSPGAIRAMPPSPRNTLLPQGPRTGMQGPQGPVRPQSKKASFSSPRHPGPGEPSADETRTLGRGQPWAEGLPAHTVPGQPPEWGPSPRPLWSALLSMGRSWDRGLGLCQPLLQSGGVPAKRGRTGEGGPGRTPAWPGLRPKVAAAPLRATRGATHQLLLRSIPRRWGIWGSWDAVGCG